MFEYKQSEIYNSLFALLFFFRQSLYPDLAGNFQYYQGTLKVLGWEAHTTMPVFFIVLSIEPMLSFMISKHSWATSQALLYIYFKENKQTTKKPVSDITDTIRMGTMYNCA